MAGAPGRRLRWVPCDTTVEAAVASNAEQVTKIRRILEELSLEIATPDEARQMLKLKGGDQVAF